ncbi:MAG: CDP-diacylglycerol--serine O-phosphatidyltransferase [Phycisphaerae bacterium]|nr:CDP-diacylglycerol--serine O-phosphatidyltransferase [Phycisphaerae bacterium]
MRNQRVKYITVLPSLITILNGVFGFTAIVFASRGAEGGTAGSSYIAMAGYMILLAMVADMLDGRLARMSQSTSSFGGQLDSLCDMVSFGVAPAFIMLKAIQVHQELTTPLSGSLFHRFIWLAALAYISCAAIRLARFNVENEENEAAHMSFAGLPSPGAAGTIVSLVIFHEEVMPTLNAAIFALPFLTLGVAVLMVSRIRYPHVLNLYLRGKQPFGYLMRVLLFLGIVLWLGLQTALLLIFLVFAGSGLARWLYLQAHPGRHHLVDVATGAAAPSSGHSEVRG